MAIKVILLMLFRSEEGNSLEAKREIELPISPFVGLRIRLEEHDNEYVKVNKIWCDGMTVVLLVEGWVMFYEKLKQSSLWSFETLWTPGTQPKPSSVPYV